MTDRPRTLDLWLCPGCGDHSHFDRWKPEPPACLSHIPPVFMVRVRALVMDERVVPIIERTLMDHERSTDYRLTAEDVFDALNGNDE